MGRWYEKKIKPRLWSFRYTFLSKRPPRKKVSFLKANQYAIKTGTDTYRLILRGRYR